MLLAGFSEAEARKYFGLPRGITQNMLEMEPMPAREAQQRFTERFNAIEKMRQQVGAASQ